VAIRNPFYTPVTLVFPDIVDKRQELHIDSDTYLLKAKQLVINYRRREGIVLETDQVYIVWFTKTLQNWKALVSTTLPDDLYYEITYNGDRLEAYIDVYIKTENCTVSDITPIEEF